MPENKQLLILGDKLFIDKKYMQKIKLKRSIERIFLIFSSKKHNILYNLKVKCYRHLLMSRRCF
jgi:hypothetical protein